MSWLHKNKRLQREHNLVESDSKIEIVAHKKATKQEVNKVRKANAVLNDVFEDNHFTLTIWLAAGGNPQRMTTKETGETPREWKRVPKKTKKKKG